MHKLIFIFLVILPTQLFSQDTIKPISPCVSELYIPNSFHSHGDCVNDSFIAKMIGEPATFYLTIYNRWGEVIFKTDKVTEGWNGTYKDQSQPTDVYVWKLQFTCDGSEEKYQYMGNVTLIR